MWKNKDGRFGGRFGDGAVFVTKVLTKKDPKLLLKKWLFFVRYYPCVTKYCYMGVYEFVGFFEVKKI